jgi:hypothetical protein
METLYTDARQREGRKVDPASKEGYIAPRKAQTVDVALILIVIITVIVIVIVILLLFLATAAAAEYDLLQKWPLVMD